MRLPLSQLGLLALAILLAVAIAQLPLPLAAGLLGAAVVLLLTIVRPLFGLGVALLLGPFGALERVILGNPPIDSGQMALLLTFAAWLGAGLARRRLVIPASSFNLPWLLWLGVAALSVVGAPSIPLGLVELLKWLEMGLIVWLILDTAADPIRPDGPVRTARALLVSLLAAGLLQAVIGIWQFGLRSTGPEHFIVLGRFFRAYGTFEQPNPFGGYMNLTALLALGTLWGLLAARFTPGNSGETLFRPRRYWTLFVAICAVTASLALVLSWSRGAWLGFLAGLAVLALFSTRRVLAGGALLTVAGVVLGAGIYWGVSAGLGPALAVADRLGGFADEFALGDARGVDINDANYAIIERLAHWQAAAGMARDDLWTGVGFGNYPAAYAAYGLINFPDALGHAHNYYLNLLAEVGLPGLLAYLLFWLAIVAQTIRASRQLAWPERGVAVGLLAAWAALAVHHMVDKLYVNNVYAHLGAMFGLLQLLLWHVWWDKTESDQSAE